MKITQKYLQRVIKEELGAVLKEGLLEDPIEQADSVILSMLDARGFRTRGFVEELVNTIRMNAERGGIAPNAVMEEELLKMRRGLDDIADRLAGRLRTHFPIGAQAHAQREDGSAIIAEAGQNDPLRMMQQALHDIMKAQKALRRSYGIMYNQHKSRSRKAGREKRKDPYTAKMDAMIRGVPREKPADDHGRRLNRMTGGTPGHRQK